MTAPTASDLELLPGFLYWLVILGPTTVAAGLSVLVTLEVTHGDYTERSSLERITWTVGGATTLVLFVMVTAP